MKRRSQVLRTVQGHIDHAYSSGFLAGVGLVLGLEAFCFLVGWGVGWLNR